MFRYRLFLLASSIFLATLFVPLIAAGQACVIDSDCNGQLICITGQCRARQELNVTVTVPGQAPPQTGTIPPVVTLAGKAYPDGFITILVDGFVAATVQAESDGTFNRRLTGLSQGTMTFGVFGEDKKGRVSPTLNLTLSLINNTVTTVSNIFLPPTIELSAGTKVHQGTPIEVFGHIFPISQVSLFLDSLLQQFVFAKQNGEWQFILNTSTLELGQHTIQAKAVSPDGEQSEFSEAKLFELVEPGVPIEIPPVELAKCPSGDLNGDEEVDMVDLSILLFWWERWHACPDQNSDGIVDMVDVSILFFWWTEN